MTKAKREKTIRDLNKNAKRVKLQIREGGSIQPAVAQIIADIIEGRKKVRKDLHENWSPELKTIYQKIATVAMHNLILDDRDKFEEVMGHFFSADTKRQLWDINHNTIIASISNLTTEWNRFPTRTELSIETKLSRVTINRHLKNYFQSQEHQERQEDFILMRERVLAAAFKYAKSGDMKAAKVFLDATANQEPTTKIKNQQNNLFQINGTIITEEQFKELPEEQQLQFQKILMAVINRPEVAV